MDRPRFRMAIGGALLSLLAVAPAPVAAQATDGSREAMEAARAHVAAGRDVNEMQEWMGEHPSVGTLLHRAVIDGYPAVADYLLTQGANVNDGRYDVKGPMDGCTPLALAAGFGDLPMVELLLERGADATHQGLAGDAPLFCAARRGHFAVAKRLRAKGASVQVTHEKAETPLHVAAGGGHLLLAEWLLSEGAELDAFAEYRGTPLQQAAQGGHVATMVLLVLRGASVTAGSDDYNCLEGAARTGDKGLVELLIDRGAKLDAAPGRSGPVHAAVEFGCHEVLAVLLAHGASPGSKGYYGDLPLHMAAERGDATAVRLLLRHGVDRSAVDERGRKAIEVATSDEVRRLLEE